MIFEVVAAKKANAKDKSNFTPHPRHGHRVGHAVHPRFFFQRLGHYRKDKTKLIHYRFSVAAGGANAYVTATMRLALAQINTTVGDLRGNAVRILDFYRRDVAALGLLLDSPVTVLRAAIASKAQKYTLCKTHDVFG